MNECFTKQPMVSSPILDSITNFILERAEEVFIKGGDDTPFGKNPAKINWAEDPLTILDIEHFISYCCDKVTYDDLQFSHSQAHEVWLGLFNSDGTHYAIREIVRDLISRWMEERGLI